ncbi:prolipoprotein diacylglyceryl transferase [Roseospira marina]|uniref:Phosphatidylglycerol--prolipoprotein diacylglyceryl transferase n=1 Tax=Roseospira marina TaxID=140057 RepID=A0A5M6IGH8_9PROT|nr:prolipoprotein diacylglyceryl transferase [Roseospira marina]KAA5607421.1 prolipoprotein diacylglyceryl transferase [Roseospira marina]MBB4312404.1 phosphatidylglycerol:prolipoprotein diacylglycerol transferase [Roseospira marina]MBB5085580.1 phosphatidylglycerol:prolipoprotein diacylglycerol transferase [Roseospira marina]
MPYPMIDPVAFELGPLAIRWYALAYIAGLLLGWWYVRRLAQVPPAVTTPERIDDFLVWATLGVVLGGRLGYVLVYNPAYYFAHPAEIAMVWQGGMAFHGGLAGVVVALLLFCRRHRIAPLALGDVIACAAPVGLFFGRLANFVNAELYGRPAPDLPWAMVFPTDPTGLPRHPSQLYEATLEGLVLFVILALLWRVRAVRLRRGSLIGVFLVGYGLARFTVEFAREPDPQLGYLFGGVTMGQILSLPMILAGLGFLVYAWTRPPQDPEQESP